MHRRADDTAAIRCVDLSLARGGVDRHVVDGVTFTLPIGATIAVMGPTGAGKSSLAAALAGADEPSLAIAGGRAEVDGIDIRRAGRAHRRLTVVTGYVPQGAGAQLPARLTVGEIVGSPITSRDRRVNQRALAVRVATLLDELMLPLGAAAKYPYELSAGMRQRVALARALVLDPRVLVADAPYANLDVEAREAVRQAILRRRDGTGTAALVVTNDAESVAGLDADVLVLHAGHTVAYGHGTRDLLWTPSAEADRRLVAS